MNNNNPLAETKLCLFKLKSYQVYDDPDCTETAEQVLFIRKDGRIRFSNYDGRGNLTIDKKTEIGSENAAQILSCVEDFFNVPYEKEFAPDTGMWDLELTGDSGMKRSFSGSLGIFPEELSRISKKIRALLDLPELLCFDGQAVADRIDSIRIDYHRLIRFFPKEKPEDVSADCVQRKTSELLTIDRVTETIAYDRRIEDECTMSYKLHFREAVAGFLDCLDTVDFLLHPISDDPLLLPSNEERHCVITIIRKYGGERTINTCFDQRGLPDDWKIFAYKLKGFLASSGFGDLLDPSIYGGSLARSGDRRFAFVAFNEYGKEYSYLCEDTEIKEGDWAVVPVGPNNAPKIVHVKRIEYRSEENAPYPIDQIKSILRKATEEEVNTLMEIIKSVGD